MNPNNNSSNTGESQTPGTGGGGNASGSGLGGSPGCWGTSVGEPGGGMGWFPGYFGAFPWGFGGFPNMGMGGLMGGMGGNMVGGMGGGMGGASRPATPQTPFEDVYRPSLEGLADRAGDSTPTPTLTDYSGNETFSMEELGLSPIREQTPQPAGHETERGRRGRDTGRGRGKARGRGRGRTLPGSRHRRMGRNLRSGGRFTVLRSALPLRRRRSQSLRTPSKRMLKPLRGCGLASGLHTSNSSHLVRRSTSRKNSGSNGNR